MRFRCYVDRLRAALQSLLPILLALSTGDAAAVAPMPDDGIKVTTKYPILDSGFPAVDQPSYLIWLDDYRVLFHGVDLEANVREPKTQLQTATYIWDTRKNAVMKYKQERLFEPCFDNGRIVYYTWNESQRMATIYRGRFGEEFGEFSRGPLDWVWNRFDCSEVRDGQEPRKTLQQSGRNVIPLRQEHGFVDIGQTTAMRSRPQSPDYTYRIISPDLKRETRLSIDPQVSVYPHQWLAYRKAYLFRDNTIPRRHEVWLVSLDGTAEMITLPKRDWPGPPLVLAATRIGIAFWVGGTPSSTSTAPATEGLYLARHETLEWLAQGYAAVISASPNGCKLAFIYAPSLRSVSTGYSAWREGKVANTLRMMQLCTQD